jgi:hypothetical protein
MLDHQRELQKSTLRAIINELKKRAEWSKNPLTSAPESAAKLYEEQAAILNELLIDLEARSGE